MRAAGLPDTEVFPKQDEVTISTPYGNWVRLPGKHHKRDHFTRVWDGGKWLDGLAVHKALLAVAGDDPAKLQTVFTAHQPTSQTWDIPKRRHSNNGEQPSEAKIRDALRFCPKLDDYDTWLGMGMALNDWDSRAGLDIWRDWSKSSTKYKDGDCDEKWTSFPPGGGVTIASLFKLAKDNGWSGRGSASQANGSSPGNDASSGEMKPVGATNPTEKPKSRTRPDSGRHPFEDRIHRHTVS